MSPATVLLRISTIFFTLVLITGVIKLFRDGGVRAWIVVAPFIFGMGFAFLLMEVF